MGCIMSQDERRITGSGDDENNNNLNIAKILLLGAGESGKSTIFKQFKLLYGDGYSLEERKSFRHVVYNNILQSLFTIIRGMDELDLKPSNDLFEIYSKELFELKEFNENATTLPKSTFKLLRRICADPVIHNALLRSSEFNLNDSAAYFITELERFGRSDYIPSIDDVLHARVRTSGYQESKFCIKNTIFRVFDVGGQRVEREKWVHYFDNVTAVIFFVAMSEFDIFYVNENRTKVNRLQSSLELFSSIFNTKYFPSASIILFLNKMDLFTQKIRGGSSIKLAFPDYEGSDDVTPSAEYIQKRFLNLDKPIDNMIYTHFTCAINSNNVKFVIDAVTDTIVSNNLKHVGLY